MRAFAKVLILMTSLMTSIFADYLEIAPKVVNGTDAEISEFPFMVSLRRNELHSCGATILSELWLMTAAHCIVVAPPTSFTVQFARTVVSKFGKNIIQVAELHPHEDYSSSNQYINDIGLVKLLENIKNPLNDFMVKLPLPGSQFETGTIAVLIGWGKDETGGIYMTTLQKVKLQIYTAEDCQKIHTSRKVHKTNVCGGVASGGKGQCSADSGGPLLVEGIQVGLVSWSLKPCASAPYPGVYTAVSSYIDWIELKTGMDFAVKMFLMPKTKCTID